jgi:signal transduction histidine kinase
MAEGTGIGLSIVKQLTIALGGEVSLSSKPGTGSEFVVRLPKATASESTSNTDAAADN